MTGHCNIQSLTGKAIANNKKELLLEQKKPHYGVFCSSTTLKTTIYRSLLFAISDLTTLKREEDYPLIFDAPTSSFENFKENVFYNIIDKIQKQCIIVTKDLLEVDKQTGAKTLNEEQIDALTCSVYRIEKQAGYDETDLSTIRTIITPIK